MKLGNLKFALAALAMVFSGGQTFAQGKGETVRFQDYPGTGNLMIRVAKAKGFCEAHGIKCKLTTIPSGAGGAQALLAGSVEVGMLPSVGLAAAIAKGAPFAGFTGAMIRSIIVFPVAKKIVGSDYAATIKNLDGKKIGVSARGTPGEFVAKMLLKAQGVNPDNVTFVAVGGPSTAYLSLSTGQVDAALTWAPMAAICEVLDTCKIVWSQADSPEPKVLTLDAGANNLLVSTRPYAAKNPHIIAAVKAAAKDAETWMQDPANFDELVALVKQSFDIKLDKGDEILAQAVRNALPGYHTKFDPEGVKGAAKFAAALKLAKRVVKYKEMVME
jgi:NitT/TauT family transport system substrate-binding protein